MRIAFWLLALALLGAMIYVVDGNAYDRGMLDCNPTPSVSSSR